VGLHGHELVGYTYLDVSIVSASFIIEGYLGILKHKVCAPPTLECSTNIDDASYRNRYLDRDMLQRKLNLCLFQDCY
jgi:hypothetical protein